MTDPFVKSSLHPDDLPRPEQLAGYPPVRELGRGATGAVYLAQAAGGLQVAIKRLPGAAPVDDAATSRLRQHVGLLVRIDHPNVVRMLDLLVTGSDLCVVMEYVPGTDLRQVLASQRPAPDDVAELIAQLASGVDYLHAVGVVHRDVKPSNVLVAAQGTVKLADVSITDTLGTPVYMAPEVAMGRPDVDGRADVYSLAVIAYEALVGRPPFPPDPRGVEATMEAHVHQEPPDPSTHVPGFPRAVAQALLWGLAKDPGRRPGSASQFADALQSMVTATAQQQARPLPAAGPQTMAPPTRTPQVRPPEPDQPPAAPPASPAAGPASPSAPPTAPWPETAAPGAAAAGPAPPASPWPETAAPGASAAGPAPPAPPWPETAAPGASAGGSMPPTSPWREPAAPGASAAGSAPPASPWPETAAPGASAGGSMPPTSPWREPAAPGASAAGSAPPASPWPETAAPGASAAGPAPPASPWPEIAAPGTSAAGPAPPASPWPETAAPGTSASAPAPPAQSWPGTPAAPGPPPPPPAWPEAPASGPSQPWGPEPEPPQAQPWGATATAPRPPSTPAASPSWPVPDGDPALRTKVAPIVPRQRPAAQLPSGPVAGAVPPRPKSSRLGLIGGLVAVGVGLALVVYAAVVVLPRVLSPTPDKLQVTSLQVKALNTQGHCPSTTFKFDGTITTNGAGGTVQYQWTRPDGTQTTPTSVQVQPGSTSSHVSLDFPYTQKQSAQGQARLRVLSPGNQTSAPATVVYSCP